MCALVIDKILELLMEFKYHFDHLVKIINIVPTIPWYTVNKNLPKLVKYFFPSNNQWTGVWFPGYRSLHLPFTSTDVVNIVDLEKTSINMPALSVLREMNYKSAAIDEYILGIRKEAQARIPSLES